jgi:hypothetical protein
MKHLINCELSEKLRTSWLARSSSSRRNLQTNPHRSSSVIARSEKFWAFVTQPANNPPQKLSSILQTALSSPNNSGKNNFQVCETRNFFLSQSFKTLRTRCCRRKFICSNYSSSHFNNLNLAAPDRVLNGVSLETALGIGWGKGNHYELLAASVKLSCIHD